jgi:WD40 repeat protein/tRNA A-37 threonylcarbamoyl transferase component Bud32
MNEETLFHLALAKPPADRAGFLDEACAGDAALRRRVEVLLRAHADPGSLLDRPVLERADETGTHPPSDPPPGTKIRYFGDYELLEEIARGGMGVVYKARQVSLNRIVALKMILAGELASEADVKRFRTEAEAAANLQHPNIVAIHEVGEHQGRHYFSMDYVAGTSLSALVRENPLPARRAAQYVQIIAEAIHYAHQQGILHRDLKPSNVLIDANDQPRVTDFGLAKRIAAGSELTGTGQVLGSPSYMPPEQAGARRGGAGPASDVYSLGAVLYELLTSRPPFQAETPLDTLMQVLDSEPVSPRLLNPKLPRDLETITLKCLRKEPPGRYASAAALAEDLERWLEGEPIQARPVGLGEQAWKWAQRRPAVAALVVIVPLALLVLVALLVSQSYTNTLKDANAKLQLAIGEAEAAKQAEEGQRIQAEQAGKAEEEQKIQTVNALGRVEQYRYFNLIALAEREYRSGDISRADELLNDCPEALRGWEWHYLHRVAQVPRTVWQAHKDWVTSLSYSPDRDRLAAGGSDGTIHLHDENPSGQDTVIAGHPENVIAVALGPGDNLASAGADGIKAWTLGNAKERWTVRPVQVRGLAYSPDGRFIASAHDDKTVKVWDAASGKEVRTLTDHTSAVRPVAFSSDGKQLAAGALNGKVCVWDTTNWNLLATLQLRGWLLSVAFSPDGKYLAAAAIWLGSPSAEVKVWDLATQQLLFFLPRLHTGNVNSVAYSPDGTQIATAGHDGTVRFWDAQTGQSNFVLRGSGGPIRGLTFRHDGKRLAAPGGEGDKPGGVTIWDLTPREEFRSFSGGQGHVSGVAFSPDGERVASTSIGETVRVWDPLTGRVSLQLPGHQGGAEGVEFSADRQRIATVSPQPITTYGFQRQGLERLTIRRETTVHLWNAATGEKLHSFPGRTSATFSPDGQHFALSGPSNTIAIRKATTGEPIGTFQTKSTNMFVLKYSPDGRRLAVVGMDVSDRPQLLGQDPTIRVYEVPSGQEVLVLRGHRTSIDAVAFNPDGSLLASSGEDRTIRLWDTATGKPLRTLHGHLGEVTSLAFAGDGKRLASGSLDRTVKVWEPALGLEVCTLKGHTSGVNSVAFSPDGQWLASAGNDGTVKLWDARPMTPEVQTERETLSLVDVLFGKLFFKADVIASLRDDKTIEDGVRQRALSLAERFAEPSALALNDASWAVVRQPALSATQYQLALRQASAACRLEPGNGPFLNTLGVAQYRAARYEEAAATLTQSDKLNAAANKGSLPADLAFLAMAQHQLGRNEEAQATLGRLREAMKNPKWAQGEENQGFLREAEALFAAPKK